MNFRNFQRLEAFLEQSIWICEWVSWWSRRLTILSMYFVYNMFKIFIFIFAQTCKDMSPYQNISEQTLFCIYSEWMYGKFYFLIADIWDFRNFCEQNTWKIVRPWHHQLTHLHIHIDTSRNVSMKITEIQNLISSLFLPDLHQILTVLFRNLYSFYWLNLNLDQILL